MLDDENPEASLEADQSSRAAPPQDWERTLNVLRFPVAALQGLRMRNGVVQLPAATGPTSGTADPPTGSGSPLRLAVVGESTAAGCGAETHEGAFTGALARELSHQVHRPIDWQVCGRAGATAGTIRHRLLPLLEGDFHWSVLLMGVNDVLQRRPLERWSEDVSVILDALTARSDHVLMAGIPPFDAFPSLPGTLSRYLTHRARLLDEAAFALCESRPRARWISSVGLLPPSPDFFAPDGFHPSAVGYRRWAAAVSKRLPTDQG